jgi:hypothetical protein
MNNIKTCVRCGYCCTVAPCTFGTYNEIKKQCSYLTDNNECEIYDEIIKNSSCNLSPAFNTGCSSTLFNSRREEKIKQMKQDEFEKRENSPGYWKDPRWKDVTALRNSNKNSEANTLVFKIRDDWGME